MSDSPYTAYLREIAHASGGSPRVAQAMLEANHRGRKTIECVAAAFDWRHWIGRPEQLLPPGDWYSNTFIGGRGASKTRCHDEYHIEEVIAGRARRTALIGPNETQTVEVLVTGESGLMARCPPWLGCEYRNGTIYFGNGAIATVHHATSPNSLRGPQFDLVLCTEIASWPASTAEETLSNAERALRLGKAQLLIESTPRRRNALIRMLLARHAADPVKHRLMTAHSRDNALNLAAGRVDDWERDLAGTTRYREEIEGVYLDEVDEQIFSPQAIEDSRQPMPARFDRKIISVDPSSTSGRRADSCGIVVLGSAGQQVFVLANLSRKESPSEWSRRIVAYYLEHGCSLVYAESNRGQEIVRDLLRAECRLQGLTLQEVTAGQTIRPSTGTLLYRSYTARGSKSERATVAASLIAQGRVSFVPGALGDLEERLAFFDGADGKPDDSVDALSAGVVELAGLRGDQHSDTRASFKAGIAMNTELQRQVRSGGGGGGSQRDFASEIGARSSRPFSVATGGYGPGRRI